MAKRFTDNSKWKDAWFMDLPSKYKLFWLYLLDDCNHAGIWKVNFRVASFHIGEHLEHSEVKRIMQGRITILSDEYWYIDKFINYQYNCDIKGLNSKNKAHKSVLNLLNSYEKFKPLTSPLLGVKDKDKEKDKDLLSNSNIINHENFVKNCLSDSQWVEITRMQNKLNDSRFKKLLSNFENHLISTQEQKESLKDFKTHFVFWLNKQPKTSNKKPTDNLTF